MWAQSSNQLLSFFGTIAKSFKAA